MTVPSDPGRSWEKKSQMHLECIEASEEKTGKPTVAMSLKLPLCWPQSVTSLHFGHVALRLMSYSESCKPSFVLFAE